MESKFTKEDLSKMQGYPLSRKISLTQAKIIEWKHHFGDKIMVSFSGGKDSTVLADLTARVYAQEYRDSSTPPHV